MTMTKFILLTLLYGIQYITVRAQNSTEKSTTTSQYNPLEHLVINQNVNDNDHPRLKRKDVDVIVNSSKKTQTSTESNILKIPPRNAKNPLQDLILNNQGNADLSHNAPKRVKRQLVFPYYPYLYYRRRRPYYPAPVIVGGGLGGFGVGLGGFGFGRGFGGRGFGGRGFGGRGFGGRGFGGRGFGGRGFGGRGIGGRGFVGGRGGGRG